MIQGLPTVPRNLVLCLDGTGNEYGEANTNVVKLYSVLQKNEQQIAYYDPGIGTFSAPAALSTPARKITKLMGMGFGYGITANIEDAYRFLMNHYQDSDQVYIFGFSRGAYTARAVAAMLFKCGLLSPGNENLIPYVSKIFKYERRASIYSGFKRTYSRRCLVHFLGLWDTVKSVGWLYNPFSLQFTADNPIVQIIRHAVSIDERRNFYRQNLWGRRRSHQDIKEVWFPGVHSDVGGSYPENESGPSRIALDWMINEAQTADLQIDARRLAKTLPPASISIDHPKLHESLRGIWWVPEWLPKMYKDPTDNFKTKIKFYRGSPRYVTNGSTLHESVEDRNARGDYDPPNLPSSYSIEK